MGTFEDIKTSVPAEIPRSIRRSIAGEIDGKRVCLCYNPCVDNHGGQKNTELRILQSVAAHMKLLLDTPEHIWRLLEKKKYLHAGWLFLLARIVYQALVRDGAEDEDDWTAHSINMLVRSPVYGFIVTHDVYQEQFPLVQRQWDAVAPLRAQITYKATLSLRDSNASLEVHPFQINP